MRTKFQHKNQKRSFGKHGLKGDGTRRYGESNVEVWTGLKSGCG